jgi:hypothetical protein
LDDVVSDHPVEAESEHESRELRWYSPVKIGREYGKKYNSINLSAIFGIILHVHIYLVAYAYL